MSNSTWVRIDHIIYFFPPGSRRIGQSFESFSRFRVISWIADHGAMISLSLHGGTHTHLFNKLGVELWENIRTPLTQIRAPDYGDASEEKWYQVFAYTQLSSFCWSTLTFPVTGSIEMLLYHIRYIMSLQSRVWKWGRVSWTVAFGAMSFVEKVREYVCHGISMTRVTVFF